MKSLLRVTTLILVLIVSPVYAGAIDRIKQFISSGDEAVLPEPDESRTVSGLKEALMIGTKNAVTSVSKIDGYFGNERIKIPLPEQIKTIAGTASRIGLQSQVDNLILSMNRAAEAAAPKAADLFVEAIKEMTVEDAAGILRGGDTAATVFFREKTYSKLYDAFKPEISSSMNRVGVAKAYQEMREPIEKIPFLRIATVDLDHYVTEQSLEGLFYMVGEEEKKIRSDPSARVTDLLKTVFGK